MLYNYQCSYAKDLLVVINRVMAENISFHIVVVEKTENCWEAHCFSENDVVETAEFVSVNLQNISNSIIDETKNKKYSCKKIDENLRTEINYLTNSGDKDVHIVQTNVEKNRVIFYVCTVNTEYKTFIKSPQKYLISFMEPIVELIADIEKKHSKSQKKDDLYILYEKIPRKIMKQFNLPPVQFVDILSTLTYENNECKGTIIVLDNNEEKTRSILKNEGIYFDESVKIESNNLRKVRKYIEMSSTETALVVSKDHHILGLLPLNNCSSGYSRIRIKGFMNWSVERANQEIFSCQNGKFFFCGNSDTKIKTNIEQEIAEKLNLSKSDEKVLMLATLINKLSAQTYGTLLIITDDAESQAERLCNVGRGIKVSSFSLLDKINMAIEISSIDGAILIDESGNCHAIGVILDGMACNIGDIGRGARYNSAHTFIANQINENKTWKQNRYVGVIISEDKSCNTISLNDITVLPSL